MKENCKFNFPKNYDVKELSKKLVFCRILPYLGSKKLTETGEKGPESVEIAIEIRKANAQSENYVITNAQNFYLGLGDVVKCTSGSVAVWLKPGTRTGLFLLSSDPISGKFSNQLEIVQGMTGTNSKRRIHAATEAKFPERDLQ